MKQYLALSAVAICVALLGLAAAAGAFTPAPFDPVTYERQQIVIERMHILAPTEAPLPPHQDAGNWTPEEAQILAALKAGKTPGEVAAELAGTSGGRKYQEASRRIADLISRALEKGSQL